MKRLRRTPQWQEEEEEEQAEGDEEEEDKEDEDQSDQSETADEAPPSGESDTPDALPPSFVHPKGCGRMSVIRSRVGKRHYISCQAAEGKRKQRLLCVGPKQEANVLLIFSAIQKKGLGMEQALAMKAIVEFA